MPAFKAIRLTNIKYNKQQKVYDDMLIDMSNDNKPIHSLISFVNSGGKGVLLQSLFQVLLPETEWGSENENKVKHFFYNHKGQPSPYTMYMAIEWHLDDRSHHSLITGIAISGEDYKSDVRQMDINYSLFTYVNNSTSAYSIDTLPYYDKDSKMVWSLTDWDDFLDRNKSFRKFTKSTKSRYYAHLREDYGIFKDDWLAMKEMNRREAGITDYFQKNNTTSNYGLFYYLIIPAIIENIDNSVDVVEKKDLISLFKEMALIAKNLPILNQRDAAFGDITEMNTTIMAALKEVKSVKERLSHSIYDGNVLHYLLELQINEMGKQLEEWKLELERLESKKRDYEWQKVNLEYNHEHIKMLGFEKELEDVKGDLTSNQGLESAKDAELKSVEIDILLHGYKKAKGEQEETEIRINQIEGKKEYKDVAEKAAEIKNEIINEWDNVYSSLNDRVYAYNQKIAELKSNVELKGEKVERILEGKTRADSKVQVLETFLENHNNKKQDLAGVFSDPRFDASPKLVLDALYDDLNEIERKWEQTKKDIQFNRDDTNELQVKSGVLVNSISADKDNLKNLQESYQEQIKKEKRLMEHTFRLVGSESDFVPSIDWLKLQQSELKKQLKRLEDRIIPGLQQEFWKVQMEAQCSENDYWIPNHDVSELKRLIEDKGIRVLFGTDYLFNFEMESERKEINQNFPLLKYGLIIFERDVVMVHSILDISEKVLHSPVPIYVAERLESREVMQFELLNDHSSLLATVPEVWQKRKGSIAGEIEKFKANIESQKKRRENIYQLLQQLEPALNRTSLDIKKELDIQVSEIERKENENNDILGEMEILESNFKTLEGNRGEEETLLTSTKEKVRKLEEWLLEVAEHKRNLDLYKSAKEDLRQAEYNYGITKTKLTKVQEELTGWEQSFNKWVLRLEQKLSCFTDFSVNISIPAGVELMGEGEAYSDDLSILSLVDSLRSQWEDLQGELKTLDAKLSGLKERIKFQQSKVAELSDKLKNLDGNWHNRPVPATPVDVLELQKSDLQTSIQEVKRRIQANRKRETQLETELKNSSDRKAEIKDKFKELEESKPIEIWEGVDLSVKGGEIADALQSVKTDIESTDGFINEIATKTKDYNHYVKLIDNQLDRQVEISHIPKRLEDKLLENPQIAIDKWSNEYRESLRKYKENEDKFNATFRNQRRLMADKDWDTHLKEGMVATYDNIEINQIEEVEGVINSVNMYVLNERDIMKAEKDKGEKAKEDWVYNASQMVLSIVEALKRMKSSMTIVNEGNYKFPLIDFIEHQLPKTIEDVRERLKDFFEKKIKEVLSKFDDIGQVKLYDLKKIIDNSKITYEALGQFPTLKIYNFNTDNTFLYDRKKAEYFTNWETINLSSETEAAGSGGQKVAARTLIAMMLLNYKRQMHMKGQWNIMISDNPFANAVSVHVVDPIIAVADALKIQWFVVAPPETLKAEVTVKFPLYVPLDFKRSSNGKDVVIQEVQKSFRKRTQQTTLF